MRARRDTIAPVLLCLAILAGCASTVPGPEIDDSDALLAIETQATELLIRAKSLYRIVGESNGEAVANGTLTPEQHAATLKALRLIYPPLLTLDASMRAYLAAQNGDLAAVVRAMPDLKLAYDALLKAGKDAGLISEGEDTP